MYNVLYYQHNIRGNTIGRTYPSRHTSRSEKVRLKTDNIRVPLYRDNMTLQYCINAEKLIPSRIVVP